MTSPLVTALLAALDKESNPEARATLLAELGSYWARVGEFAEAERIRLELRSNFGDGRSIRVSILIMVVEAIQLYYEKLSPTARDRMARAKLLSNVSGDRQLIALTSAWMAHIELNQAQFSSMISELATCLDVHEASEPAQCRSALVLGDACLIAGLPSESQTWYEKARKVATRIGDHAAIGAMTYNRAALRVARARYERLTTPQIEVDEPLLRLDVESAINYQRVARLSSLDHLLATARVGFLMLQSRFDEALPQIETLLACEDVAELSTQRLLLGADYACALAMVGKLDQAIEKQNSLLGEIRSSLPSDDQCLILDSMCKVSVSCRDEDRRIEFEGKLKSAVLRHELIVDDLRKKLLMFKLPIF